MYICFNIHTQSNKVDTTSASEYEITTGGQILSDVNSKSKAFFGMCVLWVNVGEMEEMISFSTQGMSP